MTGFLKRQHLFVNFLYYRDGDLNCSSLKRYYYIDIYKTRIANFESIESLSTVQHHKIGTKHSINFFFYILHIKILFSLSMYLHNSIKITNNINYSTNYVD